MALTKGTFLGTYEILASLGAGGMGEVYLARDAKLGRDVAIKILPENFAKDPERLVRFEREAHLLASLNHPNIGSIYDLAESGGTKFFVLELVPGETLAEVIARGPIPVDEALPICRQIADALEAAHDKGIIHRDLKPANIKITPDGKVKVLDFGLGKLFERDDRAGLSQSPTLLTGRASLEGVILGTAAYMSPEQARGKNVDRRADIWSFGCVTFELFTGKQAFEGETVTDLFATILRSEPDWDALPATTPVAVRLLLHRCLQKDMRRRLQHIGEARIAMEDAVVPGAERPAPAVRVLTAEHRLKHWILGTAVVSVIVLATIVALIVANRSVPETRVVQFSVLPPPGGTFEQGVGSVFTAASISPDGRRLAYTARDASGRLLLWVRSLDSLTPQSFPGTDGASFPFWSPDSRSIAFFVNGKVMRVEASGGPPQTVSDTENFRGGTWNRDNVLVVAQGTGGTLYRVPLSGGRPVAITKLARGQTSHRWPSFLPDGRHFLYLAIGSDDASGVFVGALDSSDSTRLVPAETGTVYSSTGDLLFVRQGTLLRQPFDISKLKLTGDPIPIAEHIAISNNLGSFSVSDNGVLAYKTGRISEQVVLAWVDRAGKLIETVGMPGAYQGVDLSPDGKRIAVHRHDGNGGDIWVFESSRGPMSRLTFDPSRDNSSPVWSPDGNHLAFSTAQNGKWRIYQKLASGNSNEELLAEADVNTAPMAWSPDGKVLVLRVVNQGTQGDESVFSFESKKTTPFLKGPFNELVAQISPDGKWIAYASNETGRFEIHVRPFPSGEGQRQLSTNGGYAPRWRRDGREIFFLAAGGSKMASVKINATGSIFNYEPAGELFDTGYVNALGHQGGTFLPYAVSPDGQKFLLPRNEHPDSSSGEASTSPITVIFNWSATLKR